MHGHTRIVRYNVVFAVGI